MRHYNSDTTLKHGLIPKLYVQEQIKEKCIIHYLILTTFSGWERKLQNAVYKHLKQYPRGANTSTPKEHSKEPLAYLKKAQVGLHVCCVMVVAATVTDVTPYPLPTGSQG